MQKNTRPATIDDIVVMRQQINEDLDGAFRKMQASLKTYIDTEISKLRADTLTSQQKLQREVQNTQVIARNAPALSRESTEPTGALSTITPEVRGELLVLVSRETNAMANKVIKIINENINKQIMPKIQRTMDWIDYNTQDGTQLVTDYRANMTSELRADGKLAIGDGIPSTNFSAYNGIVSTYFNDDD